MEDLQLIQDITDRKTVISFKIRTDKRNIHKLNYSIGGPDYISDVKSNANDRTTLEKIKRLNKKYFRKEYTYDAYTITKCDRCAIPDGMYIFKQIYTDDFRINMFNELEKTFNENKRDPSFQHQGNGKRIFMFDNMNMFQVVEYSKRLNSILSQYIRQIIVDVFSNLQIKANDLQRILTLSKLVIARYATNAGIFSHIDNVGRSDGLILTLSFGPYYTYYDLIPLDNQKESIRVSIKECEPVIMDGTSYQINYSISLLK
jgi:hypothetical protein